MEASRKIRAKNAYSILKKDEVIKSFYLQYSSPYVLLHF